MWESFIIVFREMLEAALVIGILLAATRNIPGRGRWIGSGLLAGLLGAGMVAASTRWLTGLADGMGQELFNAGMLGVAVLLLGWHNIWMAEHGRTMAGGLRQAGADVREGRKEGSFLTVVVALAVLREGAESVLFLYGVSASETALALVTGGLLGALAGAGVGALLYGGLLRIPLRWFFSATATLVMLLAAGMASQAAHYLIQADLVPALADPLWDSSAWLPQTSPLGVLLHGVIGYQARPAGMQVLFYVITLAGIHAGSRWQRGRQLVPLIQPQGASA